METIFMDIVSMASNDVASFWYDISSEATRTGTIFVCVEEPESQRSLRGYAAVIDDFGNLVRVP